MSHLSAGLACLPNVFLLITQYKADVHQTNAQGVSPLSLACQLGEEKVAEVLCVCILRPLCLYWCRFYCACWVLH